MKTPITSNEILRIAAKHHGLLSSYVDAPVNTVVNVTNKHRFFVSSSQLNYIGRYPTNYRFSYDLFKDKAWTKTMLKKYKYKVTTGDFFYLDGSLSRSEPERNRASALAYAKSIGYPIFVKPNSGSQGDYASIVYNAHQLQKHLAELKMYDKAFLIEKVELSPEYRIFIVGGKIMFTYRRERSAIIGDGQSPIIELLQSLQIVPSLFLRSHLKSKKMSLKSVLQTGDKLEVSPVANISQGSKIRDYQTDVSQETREWVKQLSSILNTHVIGVDVFASRGIDDPTGFKIIEINYQPGLLGIWKEGHKDKVFEIWGIIFKKFFK